MPCIRLTSVFVAAELPNVAIPPCVVSAVGVKVAAAIHARGTNTLLLASLLLSALATFLRCVLGATQCTRRHGAAFCPTSAGCACLRPIQFVQWIYCTNTAPQQ